MSGPSILFFGPDDCLRVEVLRQTGLKVIRCATVAELMRAIEETPRADAIVFAEEPGKILDEAVRAARERSTAVRILFQNSWTVYNERDFDLVVDTGTAPERWLEELAGTVMRVRGNALQKSAITERGWGEIARELGRMRGDSRHRVAGRNQQHGTSEV